MGPRFESWRQQLRPDSVLAAVLAVTLLTVLAGHLYVLKPALAGYRELTSSRDGLAARSPAEDRAVLAAAISRFEAETGALRSRLHGGASDVPRQHTESWIIDRLDRLSVRHRIQLVSVAPEGAETVLMFDELPYEVQVTGGYFEIFAWLQDVESELRPLVVKEFAMSGAGDSGRIALRLRLVSYRPGGAEA